MAKSKTPFEKRITTVLNIISENGEPIGYTELHEKVKTETGVQISRHTLNKCLEYLVFTRQIEKNNVKGKGNPVKFSINQEVFITKPFERIKAYSYVFERLQGNDSPFGTEANHYLIIAGEISLLVTRLIMHLSETSNHPDSDKALDYYKLALDTELYPYMLEIGKLALPPLKISPKTVSLLMEMFYKNVNDFCMKKHHPLEYITNEELNEILSNFNEEYSEGKYIYQKTEIPETSDIDYLNMYIEEMELFTEILKEMRQKKKSKENKK